MGMSAWVSHAVIQDGGACAYEISARGWRGICVCEFVTFDALLFVTSPVPLYADAPIHIAYSLALPSPSRARRAPRPEKYTADGFKLRWIL